MRWSTVRPSARAHLKNVSSARCESKVVRGDSGSLADPLMNPHPALHFPVLQLVGTSPNPLCLGTFPGPCRTPPGPARPRPRVGPQPPSHWVALAAGEAWDHESVRRCGQAGEAATNEQCWNCGESAGDRRGWEPEHGSAQVTLKVASLVRSGSQPELGAVCLLCVDHDLELFDPWATIERTLCDPVRRWHERALHRFVIGPAPPPRRPCRRTTPHGGPGADRARLQ